MLLGKKNSLQHFPLNTNPMKEIDSSITQYNNSILRKGLSAYKGVICIVLGKKPMIKPLKNYVVLKKEKVEEKKVGSIILSSTNIQYNEPAHRHRLL